MEQAVIYRAMNLLVLFFHSMRKKNSVNRTKEQSFLGEEIEIMQPNGRDISMKITDMWDMEGNRIDSTPHPQMKYTLKVPETIMPNSILRKKL